MPVGKLDGRPAGEGDSHTARMHIREESDSGIVPMNHSNKDGRPLAEGEEGRPLVKENTHQSGTHPTQSGARVSLGLAGVRKAAKESKEQKSRGTGEPGQPGCISGEGDSALATDPAGSQPDPPSYLDPHAPFGGAMDSPAARAPPVS